MSLAVVSAPSPAEESGPLLTGPEAARYLRLGVTTLYAMLQAGKLKPVRFGRAVRFRRADLDALIESSLDSQATL